jgi:hypothetical protein
MQSDTGMRRMRQSFFGECRKTHNTSQRETSAETMLLMGRRFGLQAHSYYSLSVLIYIDF